MWFIIKYLHKKTRALILVMFLSLIHYPATFAADLKLPAIIESHMVLQQQSEFSFWGWAKAGAAVRVKVGWLQEAKSCTVNADGKWKLKVSTPGAGGPYKISIAADTTIVLEDVMIGEVWFCSGQSNMQMPFNGYVSMPVAGSNDYIAHGANSNIRLFSLTRKLSANQLDDCTGNWVVSNPADVAKFSAVAYVFGKYVQEILGVPIGLIHSSWGGTPIEAWMDEPTLKSGFNEVDLSGLVTGKINSQSPSVLYNAMIHPVLNYTIRGVIWYQGETNREQPELYRRLFPAMIKSWRDNWNLGNFPFYFVQIAPYSYRFDKNTHAALLREAQLKTMIETPNSGMAVTLDIGDSLSNHPADKTSVGKRLAYWALAKTYGIDGLAFSGPVFKSMIIEENKAILTFKHAEFGLTSFDKELRNFVIAGDDKIFQAAKAIIKDSTITVWSDRVVHPVSVRYCWENYTVGTLYNNAGLPASSFRTDDW